jgi:hypothetical protein
MDVISILLSGFAGAALATWLGEWLRRRDRLLVPLFAIQNELGRASQVIYFIRDPTRLGLPPHDPEEAKAIEMPGPLFETRAFHEFGPMGGSSDCQA